jgi:hypothetical protein
VHADGTYDITYDDGEKEARIDKAFIRLKGAESQPVPSESVDGFRVGTKVEASYRGQGRYYAGVVSRVRLNGTYDIEYNDGEKEIGVEKSLVRVLNVQVPRVEHDTLVSERATLVSEVDRLTAQLTDANTQVRTLEGTLSNLKRLSQPVPSESTVGRNKPPVHITATIGLGLGVCLSTGSSSRNGVPPNVTDIGILWNDFLSLQGEHEELKVQLERKVANAEARVAVLQTAFVEQPKHQSDNISEDRSDHPMPAQNNAAPALRLAELSAELAAVSKENELYKADSTALSAAQRQIRRLEQAADQSAVESERTRRALEQLLESKDEHLATTKAALDATQADCRQLRSQLESLALTTAVAATGNGRENENSPSPMERQSEVDEQQRMGVPVDSSRALKEISVVDSGPSRRLLQLQMALESSSARESSLAVEVRSLRQSLASLQPQQVTPRQFSVQQQQQLLLLEQQQQQQQQHQLQLRHRHQQQQLQQPKQPQYRPLDELTDKERSAVKIQSASRRYIAETRVQRLQLEKQAAAKGVLAAMPGTRQGSSGWYMMEEEMYYFCIDGSEFVLLAGPLTRAEYDESLVRTQRDMGLPERKGWLVAESMNLPKNIVLNRHGLVAVRLQFDLLVNRLEKADRQAALFEKMGVQPQPQPQLLLGGSSGLYSAAQSPIRQPLDTTSDHPLALDTSVATHNASLSLIDPSKFVEISVLETLEDTLREASQDNTMLRTQVSSLQAQLVTAEDSLFSARTAVQVANMAADAAKLAASAAHAMTQSMNGGHFVVRVPPSPRVSDLENPPQALKHMQGPLAVEFGSDVGSGAQGRMLLSDSQPSVNTPRRLRRIVKLQSLWRGFMGRRVVHNKLLEKESKATGLLRALAPTPQGEDGWYLAPDGMVYYFVLNADDWIMIAGPKNRPDFDTMAAQLKVLHRLQRNPRLITANTAAAATATADAKTGTKQPPSKALGKDFKSQGRGGAQREVLVRSGVALTGLRDQVAPERLDWFQERLFISPATHRLTVSVPLTNLLRGAQQGGTGRGEGEAEDDYEDGYTEASGGSEGEDNNDNDDDDDDYTGASATSEEEGAQEARFYTRTGSNSRGGKEEIH